MNYANALNWLEQVSGIDYDHQAPQSFIAIL